MALKLRHADPGTELSQSEFNSEQRHTIDGAVDGSVLVYDAAADDIGVVPPGANGSFLGIIAGVPVFTAPTFAWTIKRVTANYTVLVTDDIVYVDSTAGPITITLPAVSVATKPVIIKKITSDANIVTVAPNGTDQIEVAANLQIPGLSRNSYTLGPDAASTPDQWWIL